MRYLVKSPWWIRKMYPRRLWRMPVDERVVYLTFDDGPHPLATPFVLDELKKYDALATFFCIGNNVDQYPAIYDRILAEGHAVGNHTHHHLNGWKTTDEIYMNDIHEASLRISSALFRPPYGRMRSSQAKQLQKNKPSKIVMWDVLSGDFDQTLSGEDCFHNVTAHAEPGSIIVFHDSEKAWDRLSFALPRVLKFFAEKEYRFFHL